MKKQKLVALQPVKTRCKARVLEKDPEAPAAEACRAAEPAAAAEEADGSTDPGTCDAEEGL